MSDSVIRGVADLNISDWLSALSKLKSETASAAKGINDSFKDLGNGLKGAADSVEKLNTRLNTLHGSLTKNANTIQTYADNATAGFQKIGRASDGLGDKIRANTAEFKKQAEAIKLAFDVLERSGPKSAAELSKVGREGKKAADDHTAALSRLSKESQRLENQIKDFGRTVPTNLKGLGREVENGTGFIKTQQTAVEKLGRSFDSYAGYLIKARDAAAAQGKPTEEIQKMINSVRNAQNDLGSYNNALDVMRQRGVTSFKAGSLEARQLGIEVSRLAPSFKDLRDAVDKSTNIKGLGSLKSGYDQVEQRLKAFDRTVTESGEKRAKADKKALADSLNAYDKTVGEMQALLAKRDAALQKSSDAQTAKQNKKDLADFDRALKSSQEQARKLEKEIADGFAKAGGATKNLARDFGNFSQALPKSETAMRQLTRSGHEGFEQLGQRVANTSRSLDAYVNHLQQANDWAQRTNRSDRDQISSALSGARNLQTAYRDLGASLQRAQQASATGNTQAATVAFQNLRASMQNAGTAGQQLSTHLNNVSSLGVGRLPSALNTTNNALGATNLQFGRLIQTNNQLGQQGAQGLSVLGRAASAGGTALQALGGAANGALNVVRGLSSGIVSGMSSAAGAITNLTSNTGSLAQQLNRAQAEFNPLFRVGAQLQQVAGTVGAVSGGVLAGMNALKDGAGEIDFWVRKTQAATVSADFFDQQMKKASGSIGEIDFSAARSAITLQDWGAITQVVAENVGKIPLAEVAKGMYIFQAATGAQIETQSQAIAMGEQFETVLKATVIAGGNVEETVAGIVGVLNEFNLDINKTGHVAQVLTVVANTTQSEVKDLIESFKYVGPVAAQMGESFERIAATLGYLSDFSIKGTMAGRALRQEFQQLIDPSKEADKVLQQVLVSSQGLEGNWRNLVFPKGQFIGITGFYELLAKSIVNLSDAQRFEIAAMTTTSNQLPIVTTLINQAMEAHKSGAAAVEKYNDRLKNTNQIIDQQAKSLSDSASVAEAFNQIWEIIAEGMQVQWGQAMNKIQGNLANLGTLFQGALLPVLNTVNELILVFNRWATANGEQAQTLLQWVAMAAAVGVALSALGFAVGNILTLFAAMGNVGATVGAMLGALGGSAALLNPIFLAVVGALVAFAAAFANGTHGAREAMDGLKTTAQEVADSVIAILALMAQAAYQLGTGDWAGAWQTLKDIATVAVAGIAMALWDSFSDLATVVGAALGDVFAVIDAASGGFFSWGFNLVATLGEGLVAAANAVLVPILTAIADMIASFFQGFSPPKVGPLSTIDEWGAPVFEAYLEGFAKADMNKLGPAVDGIAEWLKGPKPKVGRLSQIVKWGTDVFDAFLEGFKKSDFSVLNEVGGLIEKFLKGKVEGGELNANDFFGMAMDAREAIAGIINALRTGAGDIEPLMNRIRDISGDIVEDVERLVNAYRDLIPLQQAVAAQQEKIEAIEREQIEPLKRTKEELKQQKDAVAELKAPWEEALDAVQRLRRGIQDQKADLADEKADLDEVKRGYEDKKFAIEQAKTPLEQAMQLLRWQIEDIRQAGLAWKDELETLKERKTALQEQLDLLKEQNDKHKEARDLAKEKRDDELQAMRDRLEDLKFVEDEQEEMFQRAKAREKDLQDEKRKTSKSGTSEDVTPLTLNEMLRRQASNFAGNYGAQIYGVDPLTGEPISTKKHTTRDQRQDRRNPEIDKLEREIKLRERQNRLLERQEKTADKAESAAEKELKLAIDRVGREEKSVQQKLDLQEKEIRQIERQEAGYKRQSDLLDRQKQQIEWEEQQLEPKFREIEQRSALLDKQDRVYGAEERRIQNQLEVFRQEETRIGREEARIDRQIAAIEFELRAQKDILKDLKEQEKSAQERLEVAKGIVDQHQHMLDLAKQAADLINKAEGRGQKGKKGGAGGGSPLKAPGGVGSALSKAGRTFEEASEGFRKKVEEALNRFKQPFQHFSDDMQRRIDEVRAKATQFVAAIADRVGVPKTKFVGQPGGGGPGDAETEVPKSAEEMTGDIAGKLAADLRAKLLAGRGKLQPVLDEFSGWWDTEVERWRQVMIGKKSLAKFFEETAQDIFDACERGAKKIGEGIALIRASISAKDEKGSFKSEEWQAVGRVLDNLGSAAEKSAPHIRTVVGALASMVGTGVQLTADIIDRIGRLAEALDRLFTVLGGQEGGSGEAVLKGIAAQFSATALAAELLRLGLIGAVDTVIGLINLVTALLDKNKQMFDAIGLSLDALRLKIQAIFLSFQFDDASKEQAKAYFAEAEIAAQKAAEAWARFAGKNSDAAQTVDTLRQHIAQLPSVTTPAEQGVSSLGVGNENAAKAMQALREEIIKSKLPADEAGGAVNILAVAMQQIARGADANAVVALLAQGLEKAGLSGDQAQRVIEALGLKLPLIGPPANDAATGLGNVAAQTEAVEQKVASAAENIPPEMLAIADAASGMGDGVLQGYEDKIKPALQSLRDDSGNTRVAAGGDFEGLRGDTDATLQTWQEQTTGHAQAVQDEVTNKTDAARNKAVEHLTDLKNQSDSRLSDWVGDGTKHSEAFRSIVDTETENARTKANTHLGGLKDDAEGHLNAAEQSAKTHMGALASETQTQTAAAETSTDVNLGGARTKGAGHFSGLKGDITTTIGEIKSAIVAWASDLGTQVSSAISAAATAIGRELQGIRSNISQGVGSIQMPVMPRAQGGLVTKPEFALIGEDGPELILPLSKPARMKELLQQAGVKAFAQGGIVGGNFRAVAPDEIETRGFDKKTPLDALTGAIRDNGEKIKRAVERGIFTLAVKVERGDAAQITVAEDQVKGLDKVVEALRKALGDLLNEIKRVTSELAAIKGYTATAASYAPSIAQATEAAATAIDKLFPPISEIATQSRSAARNPGIQTRNQTGGDFSGPQRGQPLANPNPPGYNPTYSSYPGYSDGGYIPGPTVGLIGEDGPELVLPLSKPKRMAELLASVGIRPFAVGGLVGGTPEYAGSFVAGMTLASNAAMARLLNGLLVAFQQHDEWWRKAWENWTKEQADLQKQVADKQDSLLDTFEKGFRDAFERIDKLLDEQKGTTDAVKDGSSSVSSSVDGATDAIVDGFGGLKIDLRTTQGFLQEMTKNIAASLPTKMLGFGGPGVNPDDSPMVGPNSAESKLLELLGFISDRNDPNYGFMNGWAPKDWEAAHQAAAEAAAKAAEAAAAAAAAAASKGNAPYGTGGSTGLPAGSGAYSSYVGYADGTVTSGPEVALIGEDGPEMVLPLNKPWRWKSLFKQAGLRAMADGGVLGGGSLVSGAVGWLSSSSLQMASQMARYLDAVNTLWKDEFKKFDERHKELLDLLKEQYNNWKDYWDGKVDRVENQLEAMAGKIGAAMESMQQKVSEATQSVRNATGGSSGTTGTSPSSANTIDGKAWNGIPYYLPGSNQKAPTVPAVNIAAYALADDDKDWTKARPYAVGGYVPGPTVGLLGEDGPEMVLPLTKRHLWQGIFRRAGLPTFATGGVVGGNSALQNATSIYSAQGAAVVHATNAMARGFVDALKAYTDKWEKQDEWWREQWQDYKDLFGEKVGNLADAMRDQLNKLSDAIEKHVDQNGGGSSGGGSSGGGQLANALAGLAGVTVAGYPLDVVPPPQYNPDGTGTMQALQTAQQKWKDANAAAAGALAGVNTWSGTLATAAQATIQQSSDTLLTNPSGGVRGRDGGIVISGDVNVTLPNVQNPQQFTREFRAALAAEVRQ